MGKYPLTPEAVFTLGRTLGIWLTEQYPRIHPLKLLMGRDTRESGNELEVALGQGARREGIEVLRLGVCPTPAIAYLTRTLGAHLGIAVSASHNPGSDNGIKFFDARGYKLFSSAERRLEEIFFRLAAEEAEQICGSLGLEKERVSLRRYIDFARRSLAGVDLTNFKVVVDCAYGAFAQIAPQLLRQAGAEVLALHNQPDGQNINVNCGTLYPQLLQEVVLNSQADMGIAFDGDGDRLMLVDELGHILDGDHLLAILGQYLLEKQALTSRCIICTQMSNLGLELFLRQLGIQMVRTRVGDKYVLQEMLKRNSILGGEQSGHIIMLERTTTGDGLLVALELIRVMREKKRNLSELTRDLRKFPQMLINVQVREKRPFTEIPHFQEALKRAQLRLGERGRILVRYSGTENLARIMVEADSPTLVEQVANSVARVIRNALGER